MPNLVRIEKVHLYMGWTDNAANTWAAKKLLDEAGVKYTLLAYNDAAPESALAPLRTWSFGEEGPDMYQKEFKDYPVAHWVEVYDDYNKWLHAADGLEEIKASKLLMPGVKII